LNTPDYVSGVIQFILDYSFVLRVHQAFAGKRLARLPLQLTINSVTDQTPMNSQQLYARADSCTDMYKFTPHFIRMKQWNH